nr:hypothetical protein [uncultured Albidiferax sp.]
MVPYLIVGSINAEDREHHLMQSPAEMKPYEPHKEEAFLIETTPRRFAIKFRGVQYPESINDTALGVLLFGLRPSGFNFRCINDPAAAMHLMQHVAYILLHLHANGDRFTQTGERRISLEDLHRWTALAVDLAPDADSAVFVRKCIDEALGPYAYLGDSE